MNRERLLELAKDAGYSVQYHLEHGEWTQHIWGGPSESRKIEKFAELILQEAQHDHN